MDNEYESPWGLSQLEAPTDSQQPDSQPLNDDELGINTEVQVKRSRRVAKLDDERMLGEKGLPALKHLCRKVHLKGNGHEVGDLGRLLEMYQMWSHDMFPKGQFKNIYPLTSKAGRTASVRNVRLAYIDEEQQRKSASEIAATVDEIEDITDFRDRGRHFDAEPRYSRQSELSEPPADPPADVDDPDDLFVGMDSVDHRLVSDDDVDIQAEVSRREDDEEGEEQDVSAILEGARAQRDEDNSRSSGRTSLFDLGGSATPSEGDIFGTGLLDVGKEGDKETGAEETTTSEPPATQLPATQSQPASTQPPASQAPTQSALTSSPPSTQPVSQPPSTQPPFTQPPSTQPPFTQPRSTRPPATQPRVSQPPATQAPPAASQQVRDLELEMFEDFEPDAEDQDQQEPEPDLEDQQYDEDEEAMREFGF